MQKMYKIFIRIYSKFKCTYKKTFYTSFPLFIRICNIIIPSNTKSTQLTKSSIG